MAVDAAVSVCQDNSRLGQVGTRPQLLALPMVKETKRSKSESLSLRLSPKTRFALEFAARVEARSITTIVERAIHGHASSLQVGPEEDERGNPIQKRNWMDFWDASEGVRVLKMLAEPELRTTIEDEELRAFTVAHQPFFYTNASCDKPIRPFVEILWPDIDEFVGTWALEKRLDYWATGERMAARIAAAKVNPPTWPPANSKRKVELDDDIPF